MLHSTSPRRCGRTQKETRLPQRSGDPFVHRTRTRRSRYSGLRGTRTSSPSLLRLRSYHRCRRQPDTHPSLCRDGRRRRDGHLLRSGLYAPFLRLARRTSCGPRRQQQTRHSHLPQPERLRWHVHPTTLLCHAPRSGRSDHCRYQDPVPEIRPIDVQGLTLLPTVPTSQLSNHFRD